jgi:hypothetical protein
MTDQLDGFFESLQAYAREELTIVALEAELHKRKVRRTTLAAQFAAMKANLESFLTDDQKRGLSDQVNADA